MVYTIIPHLHWEPIELRNLKEKLANVSCRCPACQRPEPIARFKINDNSDVSVQTENLNVLDDSCQCSDSTNKVELAHSSDESYELDRFYGFMQPYPYPCRHVPCPSCVLMSNLLLSWAYTNFKDVEIEVNLKKPVKNQCNGALVITTERGTVVSIGPPLSNDFKLLATYESDSAEESDDDALNKGQTMTSADFVTRSKSKVNASYKKKRVAGTKSYELNSVSTDGGRKSNAMKDDNLKKKRSPGVIIKKNKSDNTDYHRRSKVSGDEISIKKRVSITETEEHNSDSTDFDEAFDSITEKYNSCQRCPSPSPINMADNISTFVRSNPRDDDFLTKTPAPDIKCANLECFLQQIRQPLPTFSDFELNSSYSDVTFSTIS